MYPVYRSHAVKNSLFYEPPWNLKGKVVYPKNLGNSMLCNKDTFFIFIVFIVIIGLFILIYCNLYFVIYSAYFSLTHFSPMFHFYSPLKTSDNQRCIEMEHWTKWIKLYEPHVGLRNPMKITHFCWYYCCP